MPDRHSDTILTRLMALHPKIIDLSLDRMTDILEKLDNPEKRLPPVVHVAGTNGKGSLLAYLRAMLEAAGYKVHVYTSPHLVRFAERIVVAGEVISETALSDLLLDCETANGSDPITYFEITTAAAFKAFADHPADILLLETGLGGRLDATNVVDNPLLTAITPISHDHEQYLGSDLKGIALEKAGIMKADAPVIIGPQTERVQKALLTHADTVGAKPYCHGLDWSFSLSDANENWFYDGSTKYTGLAIPALKGHHQIANAATAIACLDKLDGFTVSSQHIQQGLKDVQWPARLQPLTRGPIIKRLPANIEIWLDGGHNEAAAIQITQNFQDWNKTEDKPTYLICGMLNTKDQLSFFRKLEPVIDKGITIPIPGEAATTPALQLANIGQAAGIDLNWAPSIEEALDMLIPYLAGQPSRLLIAGSLYLAGQVLRKNS